MLSLKCIPNNQIDSNNNKKIFSITVKSCTGTRIGFYRCINMIFKKLSQHIRSRWSEKTLFMDKIHIKKLPDAILSSAIKNS